MLTLQYVPYADIEGLSSEARVEHLLAIVKDEKIILLEGKLRSEEEAVLIKRTMEEISASFKGIEISPLDVTSKQDQAFFQKLKNRFFDFLLGDRRGLTIIGPATIVKEIRKDPDKIQLLTQDVKRKRKK